MRRSLLMAVLAAVLGIGLGGRADAARPQGESRSIAPNSIIGVPAHLPLLRSVPLPWTDSPLGLPGTIGVTPVRVLGALSSPVLVLPSLYPTCLGARASRGPPVIPVSC